MPRTIDEEVQYAVARLREHWIDQALEHIETILAAEPNHHVGLYLKGTALCLVGRRGEGIPWLRRALEIRPGNSHPMIDLSVALRCEGEEDEAAALLDTAIGIRSGYETWRRFAESGAEVYTVQRDSKTQKIVEYDYVLTSRHGAGDPPHPIIAGDLATRKDVFAERLAVIAACNDEFATITRDGDYGAATPFWVNTWFAPLDAMTLMAFLRDGNPARMIEVGSGMSTKFARRAIRRFDLRTELTSIDPQPRNLIDDLADEVIRAPLETVDQSVFDRLEPGDIMFIDSSHRTFQNSDVTVFFLEILPRLKPGVLVHVHDIYLPHDYISGHLYRLWNEQYLLAAALIYGADSFETVFPCWHISTDPELSALKNSLLHPSRLGLASVHGMSYWFRRL